MPAGVATSQITLSLKPCTDLFLIAVSLSSKKGSVLVEFIQTSDGYFYVFT